MRIIERFNQDTKVWEVKEFENLVDGDIFRIFDDGERYVNKVDDNNVWIAIGEPYLDKGTWAIKTIY